MIADTQMDEVLQRLVQRPGVKQVIATDRKTGDVLLIAEVNGGGESATTREEQEQQPSLSKQRIQIGGDVTRIVECAQNIAGHLRPNDEVSFLRIYCKMNEVMIYPGRDYLLIVIQEPSQR